MDKGTLSQYGWVIICIIIIAILLGLATPFGLFVKDSVINTINSFGDKIEEVIPGAKPTPTPNDYKDFPEDNVDPESQAGRNIMINSSDTWQYDLGKKVNHATSITFANNLGAYKNYDQVYYYNSVPEDFVFENVIMGAFGYYPDTPVLEMLFSQILIMAKESDFESSDAEELFFWAMEIESKADLEAIAAEEGCSVDDIMIDEFGVDYDEFMVEFDKYIQNPPTPPVYMDEDEAEAAMWEAFKNGKIAIDITDDEANEGVTNEKDAGRVIMYFDGTNLTFAGKNGKIKVNSASYVSCLSWARYTNLTSINFNNGLNTSNLTRLPLPSSLTSINFAGTDLSNLTTINGMLAEYNSSTLDLSKVNLESVVEAGGMFRDSNVLEKVVLPLNGFPAATDVSSMFKGCSSLTTIENLKIPVATNVSYMFSGCTSYHAGELLDLSFLPSTITEADYMFEDCTQIEDVKLDNKSFPELTDFHSSLPPNTKRLSSKNLNVPKLNSCLSLPFQSCNYLEELDISGLHASFDWFGFYYNECRGTTLKKIVANDIDLPNLNSISGMFTRFRALESFSLSFTKNTGKILETNYMFSECDSLNTIDLTNVDLTNVIDARHMFDNCKSLEIVKIGALSSVQDIEGLFYNIKGLKTLEMGVINSNGVEGTGAFWPGLAKELKYNDTIANFENSPIYNSACHGRFETIICTDGTLTYKNGELVRS